MERRGRDAGRAFGFGSKEYAEITTVYAGTSTATGPGYLEDTAGTWFAEQYKGFELVVSRARCGR